MADNTIILQGKFTSTGADNIIELRSDVDWMRVYNYTQAATTQSTGRGVEFFWQRGMAADTGLEYKKTNSTDALNMVALSSGGFSLIDSSNVAAANSAVNSTITAISTASLPVVSATSTAGLVSGNVVRFIDVAGAQQLGGILFQVDTVVTNTSFRLPYMSQLGGAGTTGSFRIVNFGTPFVPRYRYISAITQASSAVVTMTVAHGMIVGQRVKLSVPAEYGMAEINGLEGNVTAINTTNNTITLDIDSSSFSAFAFPATAAAPFTPALVLPFGENVEYPDLSSDSVYNQSYMGMKLAGGAQSPAGSASDVIYWTAGKSFSVDNE